MQIRQIKSASIDNLTKKRVAAYARVSSDKDAAEESFEAQVEYFVNRINSNPMWKLVDVYADNGISGTLEDRPEFLRLMADSRAGKIDLVITKSVSRFARNLLLTLNSVRELKELGIEVMFENDHISSMSKQGELLLSLMAMHAEDQARAASENMHWSVEHRFETGTPTYVRVYGYTWVDGRLEVVPEEAEIVRRIFSMYLSGMGRQAIAKALNSEGITIWGNQWRPSTLSKTLQNEKYVGDLRLQKTYIPDFRTKKQYKNKGQWRQYYVTGSHEPIISRETFDATQKEIARRRIDRPYSGGAKALMFTGLVKCGQCKANYIYKSQRDKSSDSSFPVWICNTYLTLGRDKCSSKKIRESILIEKTKEALGLSTDTELTREIILKHITSIESAAGCRLRFFFRDGSVKVLEWQNPSRSNSWTPEMRQAARERKIAQDKARKEPEHAKE